MGAPDFCARRARIKCAAESRWRGDDRCSGVAPESAFIPFVSFGDLDNNTFKGLTSLLSVEQEIQYNEHT